MGVNNTGRGKKKNLEGGGDKEKGTSVTKKWVIGKRKDAKDVVDRKEKNQTINTKK